MNGSRNDSKLMNARDRTFCMHSPSYRKLSPSGCVVGKLIAVAVAAWQWSRFAPEITRNKHESTSESKLIQKVNRKVALGQL